MLRTNLVKIFLQAPSLRHLLMNRSSLSYRLNFCYQSPRKNYYYCCYCCCYSMSRWKYFWGNCQPHYLSYYCWDYIQQSSRACYCNCYYSDYFLLYSCYSSAAYHCKYSDWIPEDGYKPYLFLAYRQRASNKDCNNNSRKYKDSTDWPSCYNNYSHSYNADYKNRDHRVQTTSSCYELSCAGTGHRNNHPPGTGYYHPPWQ